MEILYGAIAILIAWTWVDYFRLIDIYEKEKFKYFVATFIMGWLSVIIVLVINEVISYYGTFEMNGDFFNDFLYCTFGIGAIEEFSKMLPFLIMFLFLKKEFNEPVDYLIFISISALGFSAAENLLYFRNYGPSIISSRAILSTVSHMFDTSLIAYGIILYIYKKKSFLVIPGFFLLASLSHGIYDFLLMHEGVSSIGWGLMLIYFLLTINLYAIILNNALNNSRFFTYKKVIRAKKVSSHLYLYYTLIFVIQIFLMKTVFETNMTWTEIIILFVFIATIISITITRLSRFTLIKGRWEKLKLEMPFTLFGSKKYITVNPSIKINIRGDSNNEIYLNQLINEDLYLSPVSFSKDYLKSNVLSHIERKIFLKNKLSFFVVKINGSRILIRPKIVGIKLVNNKYPIVAIFEVNDLSDIENNKLKPDDLKFMDWAYVTPADETKITMDDNN